MEDYRFSSIFFTEQLLDQLNLIYDDHHILQAGFWRNIRVAFKNQKFTFVPHTLFKPEFARQYLDLSVQTTPEIEDSLYYKLSNHEVITVFSAEKRITDWFKDTYPAKNVLFIHQNCALIEGLMQLPENPEPGNMYILAEHSFLTIVVLQNKKLIYCNSFPYMSIQDFIYYAMLVMNELQLSQDTCRVVLYGELSHDSAIFSNLYKYIRYVSFGTKPPSLKFGYLFDEVLDHRYFDLYTIHLCD